ncbi:unnamed protein product [Phytophthora lilii]|uniref:Unnamed protein product n=1 Tax=Phytophthora lilii TaxID=2077276 RepID=A0A9W7CFG6_9STRA|nr:unnamed protein product [Phytophthora lilii]
MSIKKDQSAGEEGNILTKIQEDMTHVITVHEPPLLMSDDTNHSDSILASLWKRISRFDDINSTSNADIYSIGLEVDELQHQDVTVNVDSQKPALSKDEILINSGSDQNKLLDEVQNGDSLSDRDSAEIHEIS